jgi:hypothetical protein
MNKATRNNVIPIAVLVVLGLLALLAVKRKDLTAEEAEKDAVRTVVNLEDTVERDEYAMVALAVVVALCAFVVWMAVRAREGGDKVALPVREPGTSNTTEFL